jgi:hypothetical protein
MSTLLHIRVEMNSTLIFVAMVCALRDDSTLDAKISV